jgi:hypothetical protein
MDVQQSIAVPRGRDTGLAYLRRVVADAKASGLIARAIEKTSSSPHEVARAPNAAETRQPTVHHQVMIVVMHAMCRRR